MLPESTSFLLFQILASCSLSSCMYQDSRTSERQPLTWNISCYSSICIGLTRQPYLVLLLSSPAASIYRFREKEKPLLFSRGRFNILVRTLNTLKLYWTTFYFSFSLISCYSTISLSIWTAYTSLLPSYNTTASFNSSQLLLCNECIWHSSVLETHKNMVVSTSSCSHLGHSGKNFLSLWIVGMST